MANATKHFLCAWNWAKCWMRTLSGSQSVQAGMILSHFTGEKTEGQRH